LTVADTTLIYPTFRHRAARDLPRLARIRFPQAHRSAGRTLHIHFG
jgi:hypothetical protein